MKRNSLRYKVLDIITKYPHRTSKFYCKILERFASIENIGYTISDLKKGVFAQPIPKTYTQIVMKWLMS
jgi:hypothetical protein